VTLGAWAAGITAGSKYGVLGGSGSIIMMIITTIITAACEQLAPTEYIKRHDGVAKAIHRKLAEAAELTEDKCPYYRYKPANLLDNDNFKLYWNRSIITDRTVPSNRPGITFTNKKTKRTFLIDTAIPNTHNLAKAITEKQNKYQELANELRVMWKQDAVQGVPIVISAM
jgi:hypothetical protein